MELKQRKPDRNHCLLYETVSYYEKTKQTQELEVLHKCAKESVRRGLYLSRRALKAEDLIDVRGFGRPGIEDVSEYIQNSEDIWVFYLPPFPDGVLQFGDDEYIHWHVEELDRGQKTFKVRLEGIMYCSGVWMVHTFCTLQVEGDVVELFGSEDKGAWGVIEEISKNLFDVLSGQETDTLRKIADYLHECDDGVKTYADSAMSKYQEAGTFSAYMLDKLFVRNIAAVNRLLFLQRMGHKNHGTPDTTHTKNKHVTVNVSDEVSVAKTVRKIGGVTITSAKPPRNPASHSFVNYKVSSWKCRGGIRRLKSGKCVPFKASVKHRKAVGIQESEQMPQTVIIAKN